MAEANPRPNGWLAEVLDTTLLVVVIGHILVLGIGQRRWVDAATFGWLLTLLLRRTRRANG